MRLHGPDGRAERGVEMPHVIVKMYRGHSEDEKLRLTDAIVQDVMNATGCGEESVSVAIEDVEPEKWADSVYRPLILESRGKLYKKPGYDPFD
jgi:4-oxalocrotonate tautomerase